MVWPTLVLAFKCYDHEPQISLYIVVVGSALSSVGIRIERTVSSVALIVQNLSFYVHISVKYILTYVL